MLLTFLTILSFLSIPDSAIKVLKYKGINNNVVLLNNTYNAKQNIFGIKLVVINNDTILNDVLKRELVEIEIENVAINDSFALEVKYYYWNSAVFLNPNDFDYHLVEEDSLIINQQAIILINCDSASVYCSDSILPDILPDSCIILIDTVFLATDSVLVDSIKVLEPFLQNIRITNNFISFDKWNDSVPYNYVIEYFFNDNWIILDFHQPKDSTKSHCGFNISHFSGKNIYRIKAYQLPNYQLKYISDSLIYTNEVPRIHHFYNENKRKLTFSSKTLHEIISKEADYFSIHFSEETDLKSIPKGIYYIYYDNKYEKIYVDK